MVEHLIRQLRECGFQDDAEFTEEVPMQQDKLTIAVPKEILTDTALENLQKIIANKQILFQRAFRTDSTEIEITEEKINFSCKAVPYKIATGRWEKLQFHSYHPGSAAPGLSDGGG